MTPRGALALGLALTAAVAAWWLGSAAIALQSASPMLPVARDLLAALFTVRALAIAVVGIEIGHAAHWREASSTLALLAAAGWPLVLLGQWASDVAPGPVIIAELGLLALAAAMAALGAAVTSALGTLLRQAPPTIDALRPAAYATGVLLAAGLWWQRALWLAWLPA